MIFMLLTGLGLKILQYVERTSGNIIKINNKFSQNLIDRLIAVKLIGK